MLTETEMCTLSDDFKDWFEETSSGKSSVNACRVRAGNSCGSGSLVGYYNGGVLVLTNAHVVGSKIGTNATCQFAFGGGVTKTGRIIMAAYSTKITADWAILFIPDWQPIPPVNCTRSKPGRSDTFYTTGSPSCVWPLRHQSGLKLVSNNNAGFAVWNQPAIPGQSGSSVWNSVTNFVQMLLTWRTGNGNGAGQPLDYIWEQGRVAMETGALIGGSLPSDAEPLDEVHPDCEEGFFAEMSIRSLPIWAEDQPTPGPGPGPSPGPSPNPGCEVTVPKADLLETYRKIRDEALTMMARLEASSEPVPKSPPAGGKVFGLRR